MLEEFPRFGTGDSGLSIKIKAIRHSLVQVESSLDTKKLLEGRDTDSDPFSQDVRPEEMVRTGLEDIVTANLRRAQEAARVLEEYLKVSDAPPLSSDAKRIRFGLYALEKELRG